MLTREEIEKMPAGRDLDGLIAQHVFNREVSQNGEYIITRWGHNPPTIPRGSKSEKTPDYSTSLLAAWQVVARMREARFFFCLQDCLPPPAPLWRADFIGKGLDERAKAESVELAICRAALITAYEWQACLADAKAHATPSLPTPQNS